VLDLVENKKNKEEKTNKKAEIEFNTLILIILGSVFVIALLLGIMRLIKNIMS